MKSHLGLSQARRDVIQVERRSSRWYSLPMRVLSGDGLEQPFQANYARQTRFPAGKGNGGCLSLFDLDSVRLVWRR
jgi:hypothetical protein